MQQQHRVPTVAEYVTAFRAVEQKMTPNQRKLLLAHHAAEARVMSATRLAEQVGFDSYSAVNLQYGALARGVADQLAIEVGGVDLGILVDFVSPGQVANEHHLWVMRPNVAQAIEDLGWAPPVSHLLYPDMELAKLAKDAASVTRRAP
jgi:hypothetical protein